MKKITAAALALMLCLSMTSCFKSEEAEQADAMILEMGEVTLDNEEMILEVEAAVNALPANQQKKLENIETLKAKRNEYNALLIEQTENVISEIGTVTLSEESEAKIAAARESYDGLGDDIKGNVKNFDVLENAEKSLTDQKVGYVENAINGIGTVNLTTASENAIAKAEEAYNKYGDDIKKLVSNASDIDKAKEELVNLKIAAVESEVAKIGTVTVESADIIASAKALYEKYSPDIEKAGKSVSGLDIITAAEAALTDARIVAIEQEIAGIGTVTKDSGILISTARATYEQYKADIEKSGKSISNLDVLTAAEAAYENVILEAGKAALAKLKVSKDEVRGITWYESKQQPYYADSRSYVLPYIGQNSTQTWLKLRHHYTGDDWVFFTKVTYVVDDEKYYHNFYYFDVERDNKRGNVWEWIDTDPTASDIEMLRKIASSTKTIVRFEGSSYWRDITISSADKAAINDVLDAYEYLLK